MANEQDPKGVGQTSDSAPPVEPPGGAGDQPGGGEGTEPKTYDEDYVKNLRDEAATARVKAKRGEEAEKRLRDLAIANAVRDILTQPDDLAWNDAYADENGFPDPEKILAAAEELIKAKPYLARPRGDVGQGRHSQEDPDAVSLSALMRGGV
ncbi:hypothetical protein [Sporichthya polymorpha]|uniref:hypothetical protein n=1 Tax=Sporichthya polymorpha TaxID=35751 RepID=UPI00036DDA69|nr:hypothetical protein [Sporichthya polymorpha]